jgi:hypothetical protein
LGKTSRTKNLITELLQCHDMPTSTLSGEAERPKVADAVIEAGLRVRIDPSVAGYDG